MKKLIVLLILLASFLFASPTLAYTVKKGDTMSKIARENGTTLQELAKANPQIANLDMIQIGETLTITNPDNSILDSNTPEATASVKQELSEKPKTPRDRDLLKTLKTTVETEPIVEPEKTASVKVNYSDADIDLLARIVRAEAQTESFKGKVAVACVVLNRVESSQFPNNIKDVIYAPRQFQPVSNGEINKKADEESIKAVYAALSDQRHIAGDSLFFYNPTIATSRWLDSRETTVVIDQHVFKR